MFDFVQNPLKRAAAVLVGLAMIVAGGIVALAGPASAATVGITICSKNATYSYNILGGEALPLREKLTNPANFGPAGVYGDYAFTFADIGSTVTPSALTTASCDIYFSGYESDSSYTAQELQNLGAWINADPTRQVVAGCDSSSFDPVCASLGFAVTTDVDSYGFISGLDVNPINCDLTLEFTDQINMAGGAGAYFSGPSVTTTNSVAVHETAGAPDVAKPIIIYTGNYFLTSDINIIEKGGTELTLTDGPNVSSNNDIVSMNAFSALADASEGLEVCSSAGPDPDPTGTVTTTATATTTAPATTPATTAPATTPATSAAITPALTTSAPQLAASGARKSAARTAIGLAVIAVGAVMLVAAAPGRRRRTH